MLVAPARRCNIPSLSTTRAAQSPSSLIAPGGAPTRSHHVLAPNRPVGDRPRGHRRPPRPGPTRRATPYHLLLAALRPGIPRRRGLAEGTETDSRPGEEGDRTGEHRQFPNLHLLLRRG